MAWPLHICTTGGGVGKLRIKKEGKQGGRKKKRKKKPIHVWFFLGIIIFLKIAKDNEKKSTQLNVFKVQLHKLTQRMVFCCYWAPSALCCVLLNRIKTIRWSINKSPFQKVGRALCSKERRNLNFISPFGDKARANGLMKSCLDILSFLTKECSLPGEKKHSREVDMRASPVLLHGHWRSCTNYLTFHSSGFWTPTSQSCWGLNEIVLEL